MKRWIVGLLALWLACAPAVALAADKTPLANYGGGAITMKAGDTVPLANGGTGATSAAGARTNLGLAASATTDTTNASNITSGSLSLGRIAAIGANTVLGNGTASSAVPSALSMPSCSGASNALTWTSASGFGCNTITSGSGTVTTTGSPASGNLAKFSGSTSVTNGDLSGDCTTSGTLAITCIKTNGTSFGTFATQNYATPPAIGGTTPAAGSFTTLSATGNLTTNVTGSTQCVQANSSGVLSGTGSACGSGSSSAFFSSTQTISSPAATITFTVPSGYTNLKMVVLARTSAAVAFDRICIQFNSDTGSNYATATMNFTPSNTFAAFYGNAGAAYGTPSQENLLSMPGGSATTNAFGQVFMDIPAYAGTTALKMAFARGGGILGSGLSGNLIGYNSQLFWNSTAALTSITLSFAGGGNFVAGSQATLMAF